MIRKRPSEGIYSAACALLLLLATQCAVSGTDLGGAVLTNGYCQFSLNGWSGRTCVVESSPDMVNWTPIRTNSANSDPLIIVAATNNTCFYRTKTRRVLLPLPSFAYALAAEGDINMNGTGIIADSYNSTDPAWSTNGQFDPFKTGTNGNIASVQGTVFLGNHNINGSLYLGPTATFQNGPGQISGAIYYDYNIQFPDVVLPTADTNGNPIVWQVARETKVGSGKNAIYLYDFTGANDGGYYLITNSDSIVVDPGVTITLQVTNQTFIPTGITIAGGITNSGSIILYHNPSSPGGSVNLEGNSSGGAINNRPINFIYFGLPNVSNITLGGSSTFIGCIYAPEATMTLNVGGYANNFCGSAVVGQAIDNGHYQLHFDESLLTAGPFGYYYNYTWP